MPIIKSILIKNAAPCFQELCTKKNINVNTLRFIFSLELPCGMYFGIIVPKEWICPCQKCGRHFNSVDDYIYFKDMSGYPEYIDICEDCMFNKYDYVQRGPLKHCTAITKRNSTQIVKKIIALPYIAKLRKQIFIKKKCKMHKVCILLAKLVLNKN